MGKLSDVVLQLLKDHVRSTSMRLWESIPCDCSSCQSPPGKLHKISQRSVVMALLSLEAKGKVARINQSKHKCATWYVRR